MEYGGIQPPDKNGLITWVNAYLPPKKKDALLKMAVGDKPVKVSFRRPNLSPLPAAKCVLLRDTASLCEPGTGSAEIKAEKGGSLCCGGQSKKALAEPAAERVVGGGRRGPRAAADPGLPGQPQRGH